jgi:hypothetical protein
MFKDLCHNPDKMRDPNLKRNHFDRLEIETADGLVILEGLDQAYWPALHFLWWIT